MNLVFQKPAKLNAGSQSKRFDLRRNCLPIKADIRCQDLCEFFGYREEKPRSRPLANFLKQLLLGPDFNLELKMQLSASFTSINEFLEGLSKTVTWRRRLQILVPDGSAHAELAARGQQAKRPLPLTRIDTTL